MGAMCRGWGQYSSRRGGSGCVWISGCHLGHVGSLGSTILQRSSPGPVICHCRDKGLMAWEAVTDRHECPKAEDRAQPEDGAMTGGAAGGLGSEKR